MFPNLPSLRLNIATVLLIALTTTLCGCSSDKKESLVADTDPNSLSATELENLATANFDGIHPGDSCEVQASGYRKENPDGTGDLVEQKFVLIGRVKAVTPEYLILEDAYKRDVVESGFSFSDFKSMFGRNAGRPKSGFGPMINTDVQIPRTRISEIVPLNHRLQAI